jgi:hypothetical protein
MKTRHVNIESLPPNIRKGLRQYRDFRETDPLRAKVVRLKFPQAAFVMGQVDELYYRTTIGGKARRYRHKFNPGSLPTLAGGTDGKLYLVGGRYHVTERGIVDLDAQGNELDDAG